VPEPAGGPAEEPEPDIGSPSFAAWLSDRLRTEGMTMEAAARQLNVSTKTISRWVGGTTEPRLRDLYRIRDVFGEPPFH
jgi:transcriptional regulator with XRE-family HTH domain